MMRWIHWCETMVVQTKDTAESKLNCLCWWQGHPSFTPTVFLVSTQRLRHWDSLGANTSSFCVAWGLCQNSSLIWQWSCKHSYHWKQSGGNFGADRGGQTPILEEQGIIVSWNMLEENIYNSLYYLHKANFDLSIQGPHSMIWAILYPIYFSG